jgi:hypothetical protein
MGYYILEGEVKPLYKPPGPGKPVDPGYGIEEGAPPGVDNELPEPPPGIWPPPSPEHPVQPLPPDVDPPPGVIWPPVNAAGKRIALIWISGIGYRYTVIDLDHQWPGGKPEHPIGQPPTAQPKR